MTHVAELITDFLRGRRIAVAGVSRGTGSAANPVFRKLRHSGYEVVPVNPNASEVEGVRCFPNLESVPESWIASWSPRIPRLGDVCVRPSTKGFASGCIDRSAAERVGP
jgi:hypothetical protein